MSFDLSSGRFIHEPPKRATGEHVPAVAVQNAPVACGTQSRP